MGELALKPDAFVPFLIFLAIAAAFFIFVVAQQKKWQKKFEAIAGQLGGEVVGGWLLANRYVKILNSGLEQRVRVIPGGKNRPSYLALEQSADLDFDLTVTKENFIGRGLEKLGLHLEVKVGDPDFDDKYFVSSRAKEKAQMFFMSSERRMVLDSFFKDGFNSLYLVKGKLSFQKPLIDQNLDPVVLKIWLDLLRKFTTG